MTTTTASRAQRIENVLDDPGAVLALARGNAPYPAPRSSYGDPPQASRLPWFKAAWTPDRPDGHGVVTMLHQPRMAEAARELFAAEVVRPQKLLVNLIGPMPAVPAHLDPPTFRGVDPGPVTLARDGRRFAGLRALIGLMGASGLFERWRVNVATGVLWSYDGVNGDYVYWADGLDSPPRVEPSPFGNVSVVGDNDTMWHQIGPTGHQDQHLAPGTITPDCELRSTPEGGWCIHDGQRVRAGYQQQDVRISVVWKAMCFTDAEQARVYDEHLDDLTVGQIVDIFTADLRHRGVDAPAPADPLTNLPWFRSLIAAYGYPKPEQPA
jgi:hypothetical protein